MYLALKVNEDITTNPVTRESKLITFMSEVATFNYEKHAEAFKKGKDNIVIINCENCSLHASGGINKEIANDEK